MSIELLREAAADLRAKASAATPGPWGWNSYSAIFSPDRGHEKWQDERLDEGHTLERNGECPTCGEWTWLYTNPKTGDVTTYRGSGCRLFTDDYDRDPYIASVPAHHGDTATGKHAKDADYIASMHPIVGLAVADWLETEACYYAYTLPRRKESALAVARALLGRDE